MRVGFFLAVVQNKPIGLKRAASRIDQMGTIQQAFIQIPADLQAQGVKYLCRVAGMLH